MRFATITHENRPVFGLFEGDGFLAASDALLADIPDLKTALGIGLTQVAARLRAEGARLSQNDLSFAPVIPNPAQIFCVGLNYQKHRDETGHSHERVHSKFPVIFARFPSTLIGHQAAVLKPVNSNIVDYEGELAVIIGKGGRRIAEADALSHIAGYACFNDVSMRDWQMQGEQWIPGKNFPASGPLGPTLTTTDEVGPLDDLWLRTILDGEVMQEAKMSDFIFDVPTIISYISGFAELHPGDIIATGTPGGVGFKRTPPVLLEPGKVCEVLIDRIGHLVNPIAKEY